MSEVVQAVRHRTDHSGAATRRDKGAVQSRVLQVDGTAGPIQLALANSAERREIYRLRHAVYASEIHQHDENSEGQLTDELDAFNHYVVTRVGDDLTGFVSITPPGFGRYSIDKYFARSDLPIEVDDHLFEARILTVVPAYRRTATAGILMYGALRWIEELGGTRIVAIGRREVLPLYLRVGFRPMGLVVQSGEVEFELLSASVGELRSRLEGFGALLARSLQRIEWQLGIPTEPSAGAFHGGASQSALGVSPSKRRQKRVIAADVLDAWFPPAPSVRLALEQHAALNVTASPPTYAEELRLAIAEARNVDSASVVPGAGLSDLIFRAFPRWLAPDSRVLLVEPMYSEYRHVLDRIGCAVDGLVLEPDSRGIADAGQLEPARLGEYDMVVLVEPNNPTGCTFPQGTLQEVLRAVPRRTLVWVDETYVDFADPEASVEWFAADSPNVVVGKSMSKVYALSGLRVGYLCGPPGLARDIWSATPPWNISRPAQAAAVAALRAPEYYRQRYRDTAVHRAELSAGLAALPGLTPRPGFANFILCDLSGIDAPTLVERARERGLYLRQFPADRELRWSAVRIAVKDRATNRRVVELLGDVLRTEASTS